MGDQAARVRGTAARYAAGAELRDRRGRRITPLGLASIKKLIETLGSILDEAIEDEHIERNPARGSRMRIKAPKPTRTFLEMDELVALIDAAGEQDEPLTRALDASQKGFDGTRAEVARAAAAGLRSKDIAAAGTLKATVSYHLVRLGVEAPRGIRGVARSAERWPAAASAPANSAICAWEVRLHDPEGARFGSPTPRPRRARGADEPKLVEEFVSHLSLRRAGRRTDPDAYAFPNTRGGRIARQRVAQVAARPLRASERVSQRGCRRCPTTPHTLRRTYISIALLANRFDVLWVWARSATPTRR